MTSATQFGGDNCENFPFVALFVSIKGGVRRPVRNENWRSILLDNEMERIVGLRQIRSLDQWIGTTSYSRKLPPSDILGVVGVIKVPFEA